MADFATVRDGIKTNLETISGLTVHARAPEAIFGANAIVVPGEGTFIVFDTAFDGDAEDMDLRIVLLVPRRMDVTAQNELDGYLAKTGAQSIKAAVEATAVAGTQYAVVTNARDYEEFSYNTEQYLGCTFDVTVGAV